MEALTPVVGFDNTPRMWAEVFRKAAGHIELQPRKLVGVSSDADNCYCAGGACGVAVDPYASLNGRYSAFTSKLSRAPAEVQEAVRSVAESVSFTHGLVARWNDSPLTSKEDIVSGLRRMAELSYPSVAKRTGKQFSAKYQPSKEQREKVRGAVFARRLWKLAELVEEKEKAGRFRFASWVGSPEKEYKGKADISCGAPACALGWATTMPSLRRLGLRLVGASGTWAPSIPAASGPVGTAGASAALFGLTEEEHNYMFTFKNDHAIGPSGLINMPRCAHGKRVADNIRSYVRTKYPSTYSKLAKAKVGK